MINEEQKENLRKIADKLCVPLETLLIEVHEHVHEEDLDRFINDYSKRLRILND